MIGIGRIRGSALASNITLIANISAPEQVTLTWASTNVATVNLYTGGGSLLYTGSSTVVPYVVAQSYGTTASYYIVGTNAFGSSFTSYATLTMTPAPNPVFTSVTYTRVGWHPSLGENWQISWNITNAVSLSKLSRNPSGALVAATASLKYVPYKYTGGTQTFTVPASVTSIGVDTYGAQGGNAQHLPGNNVGVTGPGGFGAYAGSTLSVTPGQVVTLQVGGAGTGQFFTADSTPTQWVDDVPVSGFTFPWFPFGADLFPSSIYQNSYINFIQAVPSIDTGSGVNFSLGRWSWTGTWANADNVNYTTYTGSNFYIMAGSYSASAFRNRDANVYRMHPGGYNGGGKAYGYMTASGGGATDVRTGGSGLGNRVIVAGGGGGGAISQTWGLSVDTVPYPTMATPYSPVSQPMMGGGGGLSGGNGTPENTYRLYPQCSGKGGTPSAGGASPTPRGVTHTSAVGTLGAGAGSNQFMSQPDPRGWGAFNHANGPAFSYTALGYPYFPYPIGVLSIGSTNPYGSGGGGGLYGGGAGVFSQDSWSFGDYEEGGTFGTIYHAPAGTYDFGDGPTYYPAGLDWPIPNGYPWNAQNPNNASPPGGGLCGYGIGAGGGGSSVGNSVSSAVRAANGLAVVGYTDPAVAASTATSGTFYVVVPWGNSIEYVLRAVGAVTSADFSFTITAGAQSALDN